MNTHPYRASELLLGGNRAGPTFLVRQSDSACQHRNSARWDT